MPSICTPPRAAGGAPSRRLSTQRHQPHLLPPILMEHARFGLELRPWAFKCTSEVPFWIPHQSARRSVARVGSNVTTSSISSKLSDSIGTSACSASTATSCPATRGADLTTSTFSAKTPRFRTATMCSVRPPLSCSATGGTGMSAICSQEPVQNCAQAASQTVTQKLFHLERMQKMFLLAISSSYSEDTLQQSNSCSGTANSGTLALSSSYPENTVLSRQPASWRCETSINESSSQYARRCCRGQRGSQH